MIGERISHYVILERIGGGGMGVVYKARDESLGRAVAIKFLPPEARDNQDQRARFVHEARAASALDHQNVCTIYEIDETEDGRTFIVMAFYDGESLADRLRRAPLSVEEAVEIGAQMASGLAAAHDRDIVHRDVKPANVMLAPDGQAKLVDFGLAKWDGQTRLTQAGSTLGTVAYMAPEQARGEDVDGAADVFSLGAVLYEMVGGRPPFQGPHDVAVLGAVLHQNPMPLLPASDAIPEALSELIGQCLDKDRIRRPSSDQVRDRLGTVHDAMRSVGAAPPPRFSLGETLRRPMVAVPLAILIAIAGIWSVEATRRRADRTWVRQEAVPQISGLLGQGLYSQAYAMALRASERAPDDPALIELTRAATVPMSFSSDPPGATVQFRSYLAAEDEWRELGTTPLEVRVPSDYARVRLTLDGFEGVERGVSTWLGSFHARLTPDHETMPAMVRIDAGTYAAMTDEPIPVPAFWIDRYEVTNAQFQSFVDGGGYADPGLWPDRLARDMGSWEAGVDAFRDETGRAGPSTWSVGAYPDGQGQHPVGGISWYEAAAYCTSVEKRLPTLYQWRVATGSGSDAGAEITVLSNFDQSGSVPVGSTDAVGGNGTYDMAGNVAEWTSTEGRDQSLYSMGGGWTDPEYLYRETRARSPLDRSPDRGVRCALYDALDASMLEPVADPVHDFADREIVDDATFAEWRLFHEYDPRDLEARVDSTLPGIERFDREIVSFTSAYGEDRVVAHVFLPRGIDPPYQAVVYSPGATAYVLRSSQAIPELARFDFITRSGRAFVYPIYAGTYERGFGGPPRGPVERRERAIMQVQDLMRTVDYLAERGDVDMQKLGYVGLSAGAEYGAVSLALETRFRAAVWVGGGYDPTHMQREPPFIVPWNYAPRVTTPVLMLNGSRDYAIPVETGQRPLFDDLGTGEEDKRHLVFEGGHIPPQNDMIRETLDWLDRYLGPVDGPRPAG